MGCTPVLKPEKQKNYTLLELEEKISLEEKQRLFNRMKAIDVALYLSKEDFSRLNEQTFSDFVKHFTHLDAPGFSDVTFGRMQLSFSRQKISSSVEFSFEVDTLKRKIFGHLKANHKIKAATNSFLLSTNFDEIILDRIDDKESLEENSKNRELIAASVKNFTHLLNIEIINMPLRIPVDMNILHNVNGKDIFSSPDYKLHSARAVNMQTKMDLYLPYISDKGVILLGASELGAETKKEDTLNLDLLREGLYHQIDTSLYKDMGISLETLQKYSSYYISKSYLSKQMNLALEAMDLRVINKFFLKIPQEENKFKKDIFFFNKDALPSCEGVQKDCLKSLKSCDRQCGLKFGIHRCVKCDDMSNPFEQVRCLSDLEACKSKEELRVYECHKRENRCDIKNNEIRTACEIQNLQYIAQCEEKKEELVFNNDELLLSRLNMDFDIANSYAVQRINQINFDKDLNSLEVTRDMHINVDTRLKFNLEHNIRHDLNCSLPMKEALLTHAQSDIVAEKRKLALSTQRGEKGSMLIKAVSKPTFISLQLNKNTYDKLIQEKDFRLECSYQTMPMPVITKEKLLAKKDIPFALTSMLGEIELQFGEEELTFRISPVKLGKKIIFYPTMEAQAIGFSRQAHFY